MDKNTKIEEIIKILCKFKQEPYTDSDCNTCVYDETCYYRQTAEEIYNTLFKEK